MQQSINRTLIIRFSSVGDIVLSSLLLRTFRKRFPHAQVDYLVKAEFADLVRYNPNITRVLEFPARGTFQDLIALRRLIRSNEYDLIVDIHDSLRSRFLCLGAQRAVRVNKRKLARFFLVKLKMNLYNAFAGAPSVAERYLEPMSRYGVSNDGEGLEVFVPEDAVRKVKQLARNAGLNSTNLLIGICPAAKHNNKMWPMERFAETAGSLAEREGGVIVLFGSGSAEEVRCNEIERAIQDRSPATKVLNLAGKVSLTETAAMMDSCSVVISNDSGLMHVAAARKRKVVAVFGPTVREFGFFPYGTQSLVVEHHGLSCRPCTHIGLPACPKEHFKCMTEIPVSRVTESALHLLET